jgi:hypothetical protein
VQGNRKKKIAIGVFEEPDAIETALSSLLAAGVTQEESCLIACRATIDRLPDVVSTPRFSAMLGELVTIGIVGDDELLVTAGSQIGKLIGDDGREKVSLAKLLPLRIAAKLEARLTDAALLLCVPLIDDEMEVIVPALFLRYSAAPVQVHEVSS